MVHSGWSWCQQLWGVTPLGSHLAGLSLSLSFKIDCTYLFLERGEGREKERERNNDVSETRNIN